MIGGLWPRLLAVAVVLCAAPPVVRELPNDLVALGHSAAVVTAEPHATAVGLEVLQRGQPPSRAARR